MSTNADGNSPTPVEVEEVAPKEEPAKPDPKGKATKSQASKPDSKSTTAKPGAEQSKGPAPWEADLYGRGLDDPRFHEYMRDVQQPYVTKMEQQLAGYRDAFGGDEEGLQTAAYIMERLGADPEQNPGVAAEMIQQLVEFLNLDPNELFPVDDDGEVDFLGDEGEQPTQEPTQEDERLKWVEKEMKARQEQAEAEWYEGIVEKLKEGIPGFNDKLFHKFVLATQGDLEAALDMYEEHHVPVEPKKPAPPTHGSGGSLAPPSAKVYGNMDEALDDFMDELRTSRGGR